MKKFIERTFYIVASIVCLALIISLVIIEILVWVKYGGKPVNEIPAWALLFMFGRKS